MLATVALSALLVAAPPSAVPTSPHAEAATKRRMGTILLATLPVSFAGFAGLHTFGFGMRRGWIPCHTPRNARAASAFEAVLCIGIPSKLELIGAGAPLTFAAIGANALTTAARLEGRRPWNRSSAVAAVVTGAALIAGGFATVIVSLVAEEPVFRDGDGWNWPFWTHVVVAQSGAALMAGGGALVGIGAAHLQSRRRAVRVSLGPNWNAGPGLTASGRF